MVENAFNNCSENKLLLQREKTMKKILLLTAISILLTGSSGYAAAKKSNTGIKKTATKSTAREIQLNRMQLRRIQPRQLKQTQLSRIRLKQIQLK